MRRFRRCPYIASVRCGKQGRGISSRSVRVSPAHCTIMSSSIQLSDLSGALSRLKEAHAVDMDAVGDDQEEELESYLSSLEINDKLGADAVASRLALACGGVGAEEVTEESEHCVDSESPALESKPPRIVPKGESQSSSLAKIHDNLKEASKNIVTNNTLKEYARYVLLII